MNTPKNFLGYLIAQNAATSAEVVIPTIEQAPVNPANNMYPGQINKAAWLTQMCRGRNTPGLSFSTHLHTSWVTPALLASFITSFDGNNDSQAYNFLLNDGASSGQDTTSNYNIEKHGGARCAQMVISGMSTGPQSIDLAFLSGTANFGGAFTSTGGTQVGQCYDAASLDFSGTADLVDGFKINIMRGQAYAMFFVPGSYDPAGVDSGMVGGTLELIQSPSYTLSPGSIFTVRYFATPSAAAAGTSPILTITCRINQDAKVYTRRASMGRVRKIYTLADVTAGLAPVVFS